MTEVQLVLEQCLHCQVRIRWYDDGQPRAAQLGAALREKHRIEHHAGYSVQWAVTRAPVSTDAFIKPTWDWGNDDDDLPPGDAVAELVSILANAERRLRVLTSEQAQDRRFAEALRRFTETLGMVGPDPTPVAEVFNRAINAASRAGLFKPVVDNPPTEG